MTYEELVKIRMKNFVEYKEREHSLNSAYAEEHNPVMVGDVVTDHYHTIRVEKMSVHGHPVPYMSYVGSELTTRGVPKKRQPRRPSPVYQPDMVKINGLPYMFEDPAK